MPLIEDPSRAYALEIMYSVPDDAWYLELEHIVDQRTVMTAIVPDEDPGREPTVCVDPVSGHHHVPYDVVRWFMGHVECEIESSRGWMALRPELVAVVRQLREMDRDGEIRGDFAALRVLLAGVLAPEDLALVADGAFGEGFAEAAAGEPGPDEVRELRVRMTDWGWEAPPKPIG